MMMALIVILKKNISTELLTNGETIKRNWILYSHTTGMAYRSVCKLFADRETHFTSRFNDWKHINRLHEHENSESYRNARLAAASLKTKNARVDDGFLVQIDKEKVYWRAVLKELWPSSSSFAKEVCRYVGEMKYLDLLKTEIFWKYLNY